MHGLLRGRTVILVVCKNFGGSLNSLERVESNTQIDWWYTHLASYLVYNIPIHRHGCGFVHTTDLGDNSSEEHGWHLE